MIGVEVSFLRILIAAAVAMVVGFFWYSKRVFGDLWLKLSGINQKKTKDAENKGMTSRLIVGFLSTLIIAYVLGFFLGYTNSQTLVDAFKLAIIIWIGFFATTMLGIVLWEGKPIKLYLINSLHYLVTLILMSLILVY